MKKTIELIKTLPGVKTVSEIEGLAVVVFEAEEVPNPIFTNSLGEEFYFHNEEMWWFRKKDYKIFNNIAAGGLRVGVACSDIKHDSEVYKTRQTAYQKSVEYAYAQGMAVEFNTAAEVESDFQDLKSDYFDWSDFFYRIKKQPEWLDTLWNVDARLAEMAAEDLGFKNRR